MTVITHKKFINDIQYTRNTRKISQNQLSKRIGIERYELSRIENGHILPSKEIFEKIANELNVLKSSLYSLGIIKIILNNNE